jgi:hypothetical protein
MQMPKNPRGKKYEFKNSDMYAQNENAPKPIEPLLTV